MKIEDWLHVPYFLQQSGVWRSAVPVMILDSS